MRVVLAVCLALGPIAVYAETASLTPEIPRGKGEHCVADTDLMRREHMNLLSHQRDETTRRGIRTRQFSLKECVACHAVSGPDANALSAKSPRHFCRGCHDYVAVKIDCFECHASRPSGPALSARVPRSSDGSANVR